MKVFTPTGREIARLEPTRVRPTRLAEEGLLWDGRDGDGDPLANGVYFYKITAKPVAGGKSVEHFGRLVVSR
ncbi:MAG: hypothetical protein IPK72_12435 [Candidatus Eisenbacteria bacterium]|nr:hypothetical protein [Candidatus Eisenbacteria bacterium]